MTNKIALKFLAIVKPEYADAFYDCNGYIRSENAVDCFGRYLHIFNPTNTDDVLKLAIEWLPSDSYVFVVYAGKISNSVELWAGSETLTETTNKSLNQAIMQCVIKAAEAI